MKITFQIDYHTIWGEEIGVIINGTESVMLNTRDGKLWEGYYVSKEPTPNGILSYKYAVYKNGVVTRLENGNTPHFLPQSEDNDLRFLVKDSWRDLFDPLYSAAFSGQFKTPKQIKAAEYDPTGSITLRAICPCLHNKGRVLGISGKGKVFGNWDTSSPLLMEEVLPNEWAITLKSDDIELPMEYKFVACDAQTKEIKEWELHDNRMIYRYQIHPEEIIVPKEVEVQFNIEKTRIAGTAIPVFSLRSEGSFGVGDFGDLKKLVDWAVLTHQRAIQILPINDTTITHTWTDSYPYNSMSIYAFHPMYIDLRQLHPLKDQALQQSFEKKQKELNALPQVDYEAVNNEKHAYLRALYAQSGRYTLNSKGFKSFFEANAHWLQPYAAFSYLRDQFGTPDFNQWPQYSTYKKDEIEALCDKKSPIYKEIAYYYYIQYLLHIQLLEASNYAKEKGVILKGDIPIGISRNSVEAWVEPYYFNMNGQAGAPPDAFSTNGQNWGLPTYNWDVMEKDHYQWWQRRFRKMAEYFSAYRIDHILGFFRIWEIPYHSVHGLLGQFVPSKPMSISEIEYYGLPFQRDFMTKPFINDHMLDEIFGEDANFVRQVFVQHEHHDIYSMRPEFDTQRKVETYFKGKDSEKDIQLKEGLYSLISNVLFVPDRSEKDMYHPRIAAQDDYLFKQLTWKEQEAFIRLYNDYYYKRHNQFWYEQAMKKLPILTQCTSMLVCGEDLGMVPECVPWVMNELQILSLEIQRMPKNPQHEFGHVWEYPYHSVCTISTHDMSTLRGWWEEDYEQTCHFYKHVMGRWDEAPKEATSAICEEIVRRHLECPSMLCILSFQDWTSIDSGLRYDDVEAERINIPAIPRHYWRYRMHLTLEELMKNNEFNEKIKQMIDQNGRN